jgi:hypothetical protein
MQRGRFTPPEDEEDTMAACWEIRGCEGPENCYEHCPHYELGGRCPVDCAFAECTRPTHKVASGLDLLDPTIDRTAAIKECCCICQFFLDNGPRL